MAKISIIIPLYNKEEYIASTLNSILSQSFHDFEIVIVNDGSTDDSISIVHSFYDSRIVIIEQPNSGVSVARNTGIINATGSWILFLDADDILVEGALESLNRLLISYPQSDICSGNYITRTQNKKEIKACKNVDEGYINAPQKLWAGAWSMRLGSFIVKKDMVINIGLFPIDMSKGEDTLFVNNLLVYCKVSYTPSSIMVYCRDFGSLSFKKIELKKCLTWNMSCDGPDKYMNKINARLIGRGILTHLLIFKSVSNTIRLLKKHSKKIPLIVCSTLHKL